MSLTPPRPEGSISPCQSSDSNWGFDAINSRKPPVPYLDPPSPSVKPLAMSKDRSSSTSSSSSSSSPSPSPPSSSPNSSLRLSEPSSPTNSSSSPMLARSPVSFSTLSPPVVTEDTPTLDHMQIELLKELKQCSRDAIDIYQGQISELHKRMLFQEDLISQLKDLLEEYKRGGRSSPSTHKGHKRPHRRITISFLPSPFDKKKAKSISSSSSQHAQDDNFSSRSAYDSYDLDIPVDFEATKTPEQARDAYNFLLLYYVQHQTVLHSIISQKEMKIADLESQLMRQFGWNPNDEPEDSKIRKLRKYSNVCDEETHNEENQQSNDGHVFFPSASSTKPLTRSNTVTEDDFEILSCLGKGAFGKVFRIRKKTTGQVYAMKVMNKRSILQQDYVKHTNFELEIMADMSHHPFIVSLHYAFQTETKVFLIMDFIGGGTLFDMLINHEGPLSEDETRFYCSQVVLALIALHSNHIIYRDLKLENILLSEDGYIKLTDFGLSARVKPGEKVKSFSGTATYLAPEILTDTNQKGHGPSVDLWCLGVMIFFMLTQEPPFWSENFQELFDMIKFEEPSYSYFASYFSKDSLSLVKGLLTKDVSQRLGCGREGLEAVKNHPFFASINWTTLMAKQVAPPFKPKINLGDPSERNPDDGSPCESIPVDLFKGFSFAASTKSLAASSSSSSVSPSSSNLVASSSASSSSNVLGSSSSASSSSSSHRKGSILTKKGGEFLQKRRKAKVRVKMSIEIFSAYQLPVSCNGLHMYLQWKHHDTYKGDIYAKQGATDASQCKERFVEWEPNERTKIEFRATFLQDRKSFVFEPKRLTFSLICFSSNQQSALLQSNELYQVLGSTTVDLAQYAKHNAREVKIFSLADADQVGPTITVKISAVWISIDRKTLLSNKLEDPRKTGKSIAGHIMHIDGQQYFVYPESKK